MFEGTSRLRGGHLLRIEEVPGSAAPYWQPRYERPGPRSAASAADATREALITAVGRCVDENSGLLLSGGLDSAAVASAAAVAGRRLPTYSAVFPEHPSVDEAPRIAQTVEALGLTSERIVFRGGSIVAGILDYQDRWGLPCASPNLFFHRPLLELARSRGMVALLDGQGGDELFGPSPYLLADLVRRGRLYAALRLAREIGDHHDGHAGDVLREFGLKGAAPAAAHALARRRGGSRYAPSWVSPGAGQIYVAAHDPWAWKRASGPRWWTYLSDILVASRERAGAHDFLRHMLALHGLEGRHPLLADVDLVEQMLRTPPELAFAGSLDRPLLRGALSGLLPDKLRLRSDKAYFNELFSATLNGPDWPAVTGLLGAPDAAIRELVDGEFLRRLLALPPERRRGRETWWLWRLVTAECWLRGLADPGFSTRARETLDLTPPRFETEGLG